MGNLIQMLFTSREYFRYRDIELIADSHFGHITPVAFLRTWGVFVTTSFNPSSRLGVKSIDELSKEELTKEEVQDLFIAEDAKSEDQKKDIWDSDNSSDGVAVEAGAIKPQHFKKMTKLKVFENILSSKEKGTFKV